MDWHSKTETANHGAALITALTLLFVFSLLGIAYVDYMSITLDNTRYEQRVLRARALASGGIQAGIGELQAAPTETITQLLAAPHEIHIPVYGPNRLDPKGFSPQANRLGVARLTMAEEHGAVAEFAAKASVGPVRCYRIISESRIADLAPDNRETHVTHGRAEAIVVLGEHHIPRILYWSETNS